jgi:lipid-binding SYLF domain-containing protein
MIGTALLALGLAHATAPLAHAGSAADIDAAVSASLRDLYATTPAARALGAKARGILVFPSIIKGGFIFGAEIGDGALRKGRHTAGYYRTTGASYGFQAGIQTYGYAVFYMNDKALAFLDKSQGFSLSAGPSIVVVDQGFAAKMSTTTLGSDAYAFIFNQQGLMGGLSLQGTKVTRIHPQ